ncbi:MAG: hypothetical protein K6B46_04385 [Opitutales bacterium]|nr:hypothetical protein [Opitutales bacterium]
MTQEQINVFVDCMTYEDHSVRYRGNVCWCLGLTWWEEKKVYSIEVYEYDREGKEFIRTLLVHKSPSRDECMKHFLEDKYWDGKSFYEVAPELEWVD